MPSAASAVQPDRLGEALAIERRQPHEAGAAARARRPPAHRRRRRTAPRRIRRTAPARRAAAPCGHGRRASGAWPCDSSSRRRSLTSDAPARRRRARRTPGSWCPIPSNRGLPEGVYGTMTVRSQILRMLPAGGHQLPAHQPHPAPAGSRGSWAGSARSSSRWCATLSIGALAAVLRSRPERGEEDAFQQHARLLHPRAQGRRAADRPPTRDLWSAPATRSSAPAARSPAPSSMQIKGFPYTLEDLLGDRATGRALPRRPLCHAAADLEHVPPLPCAA